MKQSSVSLPMVNLYKFCKREILIQPPGEPREQHLGDVQPKKFKLQTETDLSFRLSMLKNIKNNFDVIFISTFGMV
jgi:hypothetical protein